MTNEIGKTRKLIEDFLRGDFRSTNDIIFLLNQNGIKISKARISVIIKNINKKTGIIIKKSGRGRLYKISVLPEHEMSCSGETYTPSHYGNPRKV